MPLFGLTDCILGYYPTVYGDVSGRRKLQTGPLATAQVCPYATKNPKVKLDIIKRLLIRSLLAAGLMLLSIQSYGQTAINTLPYTISQSGAYILTDDLLYMLGSGTAITITASHVTLDFNDHSIRCTGHGNNSNGVSVGAVRFVTIKNGIIQDFLRVAISLGTAGGGSLHVVENMKISENGTGIEVRASSCLIKDNLVNNANTHGINVYGVYNKVIGNRIIFCGLGGIVTNNNSFTYCEGNLTTHCIRGIYADSSTKLRFNTTLDCTTGILGGIDTGASNN